MRNSQTKRLQTASGSRVFKRGRNVKTVLTVVLPMALLLCGCGTLYFDAMERFGVHKRDILVDRIKDARDAQNEAKQQFVSALEQFKNVVNFQGGDLEKEYNTLNRTLQKSESEASAVRSRVRAVENVSDALFSEWRAEMKQYASETLRSASQKKHDRTLAKYRQLIAAMKQAESELDPALVPLRDQVLFMKHNLNARAIAGLSSEVGDIQASVDKLVCDTEAAVRQADAFIATLQNEP